jgi:alpha-glucosidase (family GH31 glycosyl hydrolase)
LPLFIKAGAIIPLIDIQQTWQNSTTDPITWRIYPEGKSNFKILGDTVIYPGKDKPYTDLKTINIECVKREAKIQIITGKFPQSFIFEVHVNVKPLSVNKNEEVIRKYDEIPDLNTINEGWYYDEDNGGIVWIKVNGSDLQSNNISLIIP